MSEADAIIEALAARHADEIWATELAFDGGVRRADFWALSAHASKGFLATAYEVKISRSDFRRDNHDKQRQARLFSDRFYYVTPPGLLEKRDIPDWAGLLEFADGSFRQRLPAPHRCKDAPTWQLLASLIRNSGEIRRDADLVQKERNALRSEVKDIEQKLRAAGLEPWKFGVRR